jgi:hypothetical protein
MGFSCSSPRRVVKKRSLHFSRFLRYRGGCAGKGPFPARQDLSKVTLVTRSGIHITSQKGDTHMLSLRTNKALRVIAPGLMILVLTLATAAWAQPRFRPVPSEHVNVEERDRASQVADSILKKWQSEKFELLPDTFSVPMRQGLTPDAQRSSVQRTKDLFGDYKGISFAEAVVSTDMPNLTVYRFRGTFSKSDEKPEIRVVVENGGKVSGFWIKPWADQLQ